MALVVSIPAAASAADGAPVSAGDWWPEIAPADVRALMKLPETIPAARLRVAIVNGMASALTDLADWQACQQAAGVARLSDIAAPEIDGVSSRVQAWRRAVMSYAAADLSEMSAEISATNEGLHRAAENALPVDAHLRNALHAIRDIKGKRRSKVRVI
ncbi:head completion/stabilization protein [Sphingomonas sp. PR090111-T3T-6A]|uniref:head completion/stabilization protein n=1 Tax=Sphingomonas sp. PR090111-T3T-6A TaxID=685778 RepID=UPI00037D6585|nr:head completion/stabilization protein [Sphingomonas sp. PR090111-T3T-6A]